MHIPIFDMSKFYDLYYMCNRFFFTKIDIVRDKYCNFLPEPRAWIHNVSSSSEYGIRTDDRCTLNLIGLRYRLKKINIGEGIIDISPPVKAWRTGCRSIGGMSSKDASPFCRWAPSTIGDGEAQWSVGTPPIIVSSSKERLHFAAALPNKHPLGL